MDFIDFLNQYWTLLCGMISFVFACGYTYFSIKQIAKDHSTDMVLIQDQMKEQRDDHDHRLTAVETNLASANTKVDTLKDDVYKSINLIQLDIREIMTILRNKKRK